MKRNLFTAPILILAAAFVILIAGDANAQTAKRISFLKGKTSTIVKGIGKQSYMLRVGAGQNCKIQLISAKNSAMLEVLDEQGMDLTEGSDGRSFEGSFETAGDYRINVSTNGKTTFTLKISVQNN